MICQGYVDRKWLNQTLNPGRLVRKGGIYNANHSAILPQIYLMQRQPITEELGLGPRSLGFHCDTSNAFLPSSPP